METEKKTKAKNYNDFLWLNSMLENMRLSYINVYIKWAFYYFLF